MALGQKKRAPRLPWSNDAKDAFAALGLRQEDRFSFNVWLLISSYVESKWPKCLEMQRGNYLDKAAIDMHTRAFLSTVGRDIFTGQNKQKYPSLKVWHPKMNDDE